MENNDKLLGDIKKWIRENLFDSVPVSIAIIDRDYNIVYANKAFSDKFGQWKNQKCYSVYKNRETICMQCNGSKAFKDGIQKISEETGYTKSGDITKYIKHTIPIIDENKNIPYLIEMSTDVTELEKIKQDHRLIFDQAPCNIVIIDKDFKITKTNIRLNNLLGNLVGQNCYRALKRRDTKCDECTALESFSDGKIHTGHHTWISGKGKTHHLHVTTIPVNDNGADLIMEMAVDISETLRLEDRLKKAHTFISTIISTSIDGIIALDQDENITVLNPAAREIFDIENNIKISKDELANMLPENVIHSINAGTGPYHLPSTEIETLRGNKIPVRLIGRKLVSESIPMGMAFSIQNLKEIKRLEKEKLEAERMAAVGQTVAGLAHGVKNLLTSLEGGMYMLNSGINKGKIDRVGKGLEMLSRNINRISMFVKAFLDFSKGRTIKAKLCDPCKIAEEVVQSYVGKAKELGIELKNISSQDIERAPIDYESMHECLTNLIGNAMDACCMSDEKENCHVYVKTSEKNGIIIYEVADNGCGMDYEVKSKVFTNFFTTKGLGGTGIGLLMTKKIVYEHGGVIEFESEPQKGTIFRIILQRDRLPEPVNEK